MRTDLLSVSLDRKWGWHEAIQVRAAAPPHRCGRRAHAGRRGAPMLDLQPACLKTRTNARSPGSDHGQPGTFGATPRRRPNPTHQQGRARENREQTARPRNRKAAISCCPFPSLATLSGLWRQGMGAQVLHNRAKIIPVTVKVRLFHAEFVQLFKAWIADEIGNHETF